MKTRDPFKIIGIDEQATLAEAKTAYRKKVKKNHPDRVANNPSLKNIAEEKMKEINVAYKSVMTILTDREKKTAKNSTTSNPSPQKKQPKPKPQKQKQHTSSTRKKAQDPKKNRAKRTNTGEGVPISEMMELFLKELRKFNLKNLRPKNSIKKKTSSSAKPGTGKSRESFNEIFSEIMNERIRPQSKKASKADNLKKKRAGNPYAEYTRKSRTKQQNSGPVGGVKPVSRVRGLYRDN